LKGDLSNMLQVADLVKFAKAEPGADFHAQVLEQAKEFVLKTKPLVVSEEYVDAKGNLVDKETGLRLNWIPTPDQTKKP
jgi:hypothetical protein